ncbi:MAG: hypothetical protein FWE04_04340 [Oscillospiraceae bacterium]|nr:hypothetical protein [Oscillospiraceae bacterium]
MKNKKIIDALDTIRLNAAADKRILEKIKQKQQRNKKRPVFRTAISLATTAAVLMFAVFGVRFFAPDVNNTFSLQAFAMEVQEDGTFGLREIDLMTNEFWAGHFDGDNFFVSVGLRYKGNNIQNVEFSTNEGFFATQRIRSLAHTESVPHTYMGLDSQLMMFGTEFYVVGNAITFGSAMDDDILLFWGSNDVNIDNIPESIEIRANVIFNDGETYEQTAVIDLSGRGSINIATEVTPDERREGYGVLWNPSMVIDLELY